MRKGLIIVDLQKSFLNLEVCKDSFDIAMPKIRSAIASFHERDSPVIFTRTSEAVKLGPRAGWELADGLEILAGDRILDKSFPNAFGETDLDQWLRDRSVESVVVCGCFSMSCVYLTHYGAIERSFESRILQDGTVSSNPEAIRVLNQMVDSASLDEIFSP